MSRRAMTLLHGWSLNRHVFGGLTPFLSHPAIVADAIREFLHGLS